MTGAEAIAILSGLVNIFDRVGVWPPLLIVVLVLIVPWAVLIYTDSRHQKRHEEALRMYQDNVLLVESYERHVGSLEHVVQDLNSMHKEYHALLALMTKQITDAAAAIEHNQFCPLVREKTKETPRP